MTLLLLKLVLLPLIIAGVTLAGRRWGPAVSGMLVALPLTSGPIIVFLALSDGDAFAAKAAAGILAGTASTAVFCLAYSWLVFVARWPIALVAGWAVFFAATAALQPVALPAAPLFAGEIVLLAIVVALLPRPVGVRALREPPRWDLPARIVLGTAFVLLLTELASVLGPHLSGLLTPFPLYVSIFGGFTHADAGPGATVVLVRGVVVGLVAFAAFFTVVTLLIQRDGMVVTGLLAIVVALALQVMSYGVVLRNPGHAARGPKWRLLRR